MIYQSVLIIKVCRVQFTETPHDVPDFFLFGFQLQMKVVGHQTVAVQNIWIDFLCVTQ
jgi:hypothetical protein